MSLLMSLGYRRILVLGSNSFTGAHFVDFLLNETDAEIMGLSRSVEYEPERLPYAYGKPYPKRFHFNKIDLNHRLEEGMGLIDSFKPDLVVNFAAQGEVRNSWKWPEQWFETNCLGVVKLGEALRKRDYLAKYVAISTPEVYGNTGLDTVENETYRPSTPYATSKLAGDLHLQTLVSMHGFPAVFTRAANLYGVHQQLYRIIPRAIIYLTLGKKITLHGGGLAERAFIHAKDVADGTWRAACKGQVGEVYHLAPEGELRSIASVVNMICGMMGKSFEESVELVEENFGQDACFSLDASKARRDLEWKTNVKFESAVEEMIAWIERNWEFVVSQPLEYVHIPS